MATTKFYPCRPTLSLPDALPISLAQILLGHLAELLLEDDDAVPFGALAPLSRVAVAPGFRGGERQVGDLGAVLGAADLWTAPQVAHQDDFVHTARHAVFLQFLRVALPESERTRAA